MPSSSLFLRSSTTLVTLLSLFSASTSTSTPSQAYKSVRSYVGEDFYNEFTFWDTWDPTHGFVTYLGKDSAKASGLTRITDKNSFIMDVDSTNVYDASSPYWEQNGYGRPSIRIQSKATYTKGLFVADIADMPGGVCGVWPAYWTLADGTTWPQGGEIDIIEGVSNRQYSIGALHTSGKSSITGDASTMSGTLSATDCQYTEQNKNSAGCVVSDYYTGGYGATLSANGGHIVAMEWTDDAVKIWNFPKSLAPSDINSDSPDPSKWGLPTQAFSGPDANLKANLANHKIVFDTTFCGDFGNAVWSSEGCAAQTGYSSCAAFVADNPAAFKGQNWEINSVRVYQLAAAAVTTTSTTTSTTTTTSVRTTLTTTTRALTTTSTTSEITTTSYNGRSTSHSYSDTTTSEITTTSYNGRSTSHSYSDTTTSNDVSSTTSTTYSHPTSGSSSSRSYSDTSFSRPSETTSYTFSTPSGGFSHSTTETASVTSMTESSTRDRSSHSTPAPEDQTTAPIEGSHSLPGFANGGASASKTWADWSNEPSPTFITTTLTKTYVVPCATGLETKTATVVTSFAGGKKTTYTPEVPFSTYTTSCPPDWGFGGPVTVTVPITTTKTIIGVKAPTAGTGSDNANGNGYGKGSDSSVGNGNNQNGDKNGDASNGQNGNSYNNGNGNGYNNGNGNNNSNNYGNGNGNGNGSGNDGSSDHGEWNSWNADATATPAATTWTGAAKTNGVAAATGTGYGNDNVDWSSWSNSNSNATSPIAVYKGSAVRTTGGSMVAVIVAGILSLML